MGEQFIPGVNMYALEIGGYNTWTDWNLVPTSRPTIPPPEVRTRFVEIPGMNGTLDMTDVYTDNDGNQNGIYGDRKGSFEFIVLNPRLSVAHPFDGQAHADRSSEWLSVYSVVMEKLHCKRKRMILLEDPDYWYEGRFTVDSWQPGDDYSTLTIGYTLEPFKYPMPMNDENKLRGVL